jgi:hypothetical protein
VGEGEEGGLGGGEGEHGSIINEGQSR